MDRRVIELGADFIPGLRARERLSGMPPWVCPRRHRCPVDDMLAFLRRHRVIDRSAGQNVFEEWLSAWHLPMAHVSADILVIDEALLLAMHFCSKVYPLRAFMERGRKLFVVTIQQPSQALSHGLGGWSTDGSRAAKLRKGRSVMINCIVSLWKYCGEGWRKVFRHQTPRIRLQPIQNDSSNLAVYNYHETRSASHCRPAWIETITLQ